jgi:AraC-like DNA-binding protein
VRKALGAAYPNATCFEFGSRDCDASFDCRVVGVAEVTIHRTQSSGYRCRQEPNDDVRLTLPARGKVTVVSRRSQTVAVAGVSGTVGRQDIVGREIQANYLGFHVRIPKDHLLSAARTLTGRLFGDGEIETSIDLRAPVGGSLFRAVGSLFTDVEHLSMMGLSRLASASTGDLVVNIAAAAVLPRLRERLVLPERLLGASTVESARQYIDAHASEPIRFGDLADRFDVGLRALQVGFKKQLGCTLTEYLFRRRLDLARARLSAPTATMTVTAVALECGFVNVGAFADRYRRAFGELPSQTLRRVVRKS